MRSSKAPIRRSVENRRRFRALAYRRRNAGSGWRVGSRKLIARSFTSLAGTPIAWRSFAPSCVLGSSLGMITTAEGVETEEQLEILRAEGCMQVQRFLFSKAIAATEIPHLLRRLRSRVPGSLAHSSGCQICRGG